MDWAGSLLPIARMTRVESDSPLAPLLDVSLEVLPQTTTKWRSSTTIKNKKIIKTGSPAHPFRSSTAVLIREAPSRSITAESADRWKLVPPLLADVDRLATSA